MERVSLFPLHSDAARPPTGNLFIWYALFFSLHFVPLDFFLGGWRGFLSFILKFCLQIGFVRPHVVHGCKHCFFCF